jgi:hypothetical protein
VVVESVNRAARYAEGLARANVERTTGHAPTTTSYDTANPHSRMTTEMIQVGALSVRFPG